MTPEQLGEIIESLRREIEKRGLENILAEVDEEKVEEEVGHNVGDNTQLLDVEGTQLITFEDLKKRRF